MYGEIVVNVKELKKISINTDNVKLVDALYKANGRLFTLDVRPYYAIFSEFGVNFSGPVVKP